MSDHNTPPQSLFFLLFLQHIPLLLSSSVCLEALKKKKKKLSLWLNPSLLSNLCLNCTFSLRTILTTIFKRVCFMLDNVEIICSGLNFSQSTIMNTGKIVKKKKKTLWKHWESLKIDLEESGYLKERNVTERVSHFGGFYRHRTARIWIEIWSFFA